jgi:hypothetical protein
MINPKELDHRDYTREKSSLEEHPDYLEILVFIKTYQHISRMY